MDAPSLAISAHRRPKWVAALLGISLGLALCGSLFGVLAYWHASYVDGQEVCIRCGSNRDVKRRGPVDWTSAPRIRPSQVLDQCEAHLWKRSGCWLIDGGNSHLPAARFLARPVEDVMRQEYELSIGDLGDFIEGTPPEARALRIEARRWLSYALNESGDPEGSLTELSIAIEEDPRDAWLRYEQGRAWTAIGDYERAIDGYRAATELDPGLARAWQWLGHCLLLLERPGEALAGRHAGPRARRAGRRAEPRVLANRAHRAPARDPGRARALLRCARRSRSRAARSSPSGGAAGHESLT